MNLDLITKYVPLVAGIMYALVGTAYIMKKDIGFKSIKSLEYITNIFFSNKRKMVNKAFKKLKINNEEFLKKQKIDLTLRPEKLSEKIFYKIAEFYEKKITK